MTRWRDAGDGLPDRDAFVDFTTLSHRWRKFPFLDPGLPVELLPPDWGPHRRRPVRRAVRVDREARAPRVDATVAGTPA